MSVRVLLSIYGARMNRYAGTDVWHTPQPASLAPALPYLAAKMPRSYPAVYERETCPPLVRGQMGVEQVV